MKQFKIVVSVMLVAVLMVGLFAGCSLIPLRGTYKSTGALGETLTFEKDHKVTGKLFGITLDGEYEIDDDTITFKYSGTWGLGATLSKSFERKGDSIWIDGTEFVKE